MDMQLKRDILQALRDATTYGAGNWEDLISRVEQLPAECNNWPCCPCGNPSECVHLQGYNHG